MILASHAIIGAAAGRLIPDNFYLGFLFGIISHFIVDAIPHSEYALRSTLFDKEGKAVNMSWNKDFIMDLFKISADIIIGVGLAFIIFKTNTDNDVYAILAGIALTFSSTIIVVSLLSEKKDINSLYGKISVGFLLVQDFIAILLLILLSGIGGEKIVLSDSVFTIMKGAGLFIAMLYLGRKILPLIFNKIAGSRELLFLISLAWCFSMTILTIKLGFSIEIGGLLAGLALANSSEHFQISARIKPLKDFFILIFFVLLR